MTEKTKWWKSDLAQKIGFIAVIFTIIGGVIGILKLIDWSPLSSFLELTVPMSYFIFFSLVVLLLFSIPMSFPDYFFTTPLKDAKLLRYGCVRYMAKLCRTPQTTAYVKQKYANFYLRHNLAKFSNSQTCLQAMEEKGLVKYDDEKKVWKTTQKSVDYLKKYYGYENIKVERS